ncbi:MAG: endonuclease [Polyangiaceae bacterium]
MRSNLIRPICSRDRALHTAPRWMMVGVGLACVSQMSCRPATAQDPPSEPAATKAPAAIAQQSAFEGNPSKIDFSRGKKHLRGMYRGARHETVYAGCSFRDWTLDWTRCCIANRGHVRDRLEWEHVVPAAAFGRPLRVWQKGHAKCVSSRGKTYRGRRCAKKTSERFRRMEGDMHNLLPSIGRLNQARGHRAMGLITGERRPHGTCDFELDGPMVEPRPAVRGDIARAYLYMHDAYPGLGILTEATRPMWSRWHAKDPPSAWEKKRNELISAEQGNRNPYIQ